MTERRRHRRVDLPVLVQIRYTATEAPKTVYAINVSESGLFLDVDDGKPLGTRVFVQVTTTDGNQLLRGEGRVVRRVVGSNGDGGVGGGVGVDSSAAGVGVELVGFVVDAGARDQAAQDDG